MQGCLLKNAMKKFYSDNQLIRKTIRLSVLIGINYPESYKLLEETPLFLSHENNKQAFRSELENYLDSLEHINLHARMS